MLVSRELRANAKTPSGSGISGRVPKIWSKSGPFHPQNALTGDFLTLPATASKKPAAHAAANAPHSFARRTAASKTASETTKLQRFIPPKTLDRNAHAWLNR